MLVPTRVVWGIAAIMMGCGGAQAENMQACVDAKERGLAAHLEESWQALERAAQEELVRCAGLDDSYETAMSHASIAYARSSSGRFPEALEAAAACLAADDNNVRCHRERSRALEGMGRTGEAAIATKAAIEAGPGARERARDALARAKSPSERTRFERRVKAIDSHVAAAERDLARMRK